jgi:amino acid adenylation domain-containing protein
MSTEPEGKPTRSAVAESAAGCQPPRPTSTAAVDEVPAGNDLQHELARLWAEVLGVPVGVDADFTDLGINSIDVARILARLRARHGYNLTFREVFEARNVRVLAGRLGGNGGQPGAGDSWPPLRPATHCGPEAIPSPGQQRLWFLDHLHATAGVAYNIPVAAWLHGPLDLTALQSALADVSRRHEQLRSAFVLADGRLTVQVGTELPQLRVVDLRDHPDPQGEAGQRAERLAAEHMDLRDAPLLRCTVFRVGTHDHLMIVVFHHLIADGWTVDLADRELAEAYQARVAGTQPPVAGNRLEYRDYAQWQHNLDASPALSRTLDFWRGQLAGAPMVLELPADRSRPAVRSHRGRRLSRAAPAGLLAAVRQVAEATRTTPYSVSLAAFGLLLAELTGTQDFLIASPAAGRPDPALEEVAGFFATTVLVRLRLGNGTFRELVETAHETALDALEHQYVPFERLAAEFAPPGDLSRPPLAQVALAYQGPRRPYAALAGLTVRPVEVDNGTAKFDLTAELHEVGGELEVILEYSTDLFAPERAEAMLDRFLGLLATAASAPGTPIAGLSSQPAAARPEPSGPADRERCLHEIFADVAARWPTRIAVTDGGRSLSYAELDHASSRLAQRLRSLGAAPEQLVAVCAEQTVDLVMAVLAVLKSGAGYLPLDPRYPAARLSFMLADAGCHILVGDEELCQPLTGDGRILVGLSEPLSDEPAEPRSVPARPENVAYVIYTSGSTGTPKGVVVSHANVTRLFSATADQFRFGPDDVWTLFHSLAFDFSVWELWGALLHGGRLVVVSHLTSREPAAFLDLLRTQRVTVLNQTPTAFRQLAAAAEDARFPGLALRVVIFGGEALDPATLKGWVAGYGTTRPCLVNMYGITETTVHVTLRPIDVSDLAGTASPIGRPIGDLRVHILDDGLAELPAGTEGEMYVGGAGVSRGYLGRPALTAERFVPDPFGGPGARLYRTGDLAVRRPDGELEFRGRADSQVKLRGFRIELGEIERALHDQPEVRAAACLVREDTPGQPRLVAYLVMGSGRAVPTAEIRAALRERLPEHMVPAAYVVVPKLPLTENGKLDRARLPAPHRNDGLLRSGSLVSPRSPAERTLATVWSDVLGIAEPDMHDNFFALGGDSIVAVRLAAAARGAGVPLTVEDVFLRPTIAQLAAAATSVPVVTTPDAGPSTSLPDLDEAEVPPGAIDAYPTAAMQLGILFDCELAEDSALYHDLVSVRLTGEFDLPALRRALATACSRHDVLRTSFHLADYREPIQLVYREATVPVEVEDLAGRPASAEECDAALRDWWLREQGTPFDLARPPLVRCHVLRRSADSWQCSLSVHHVVLDGWSLARLITEVLLDYDAQLTGTGGALPPIASASYRDFVVAEQAAAANADAERFWRGRVSSDPPPALPVLPGGDGTGQPAFRAELPRGLDRQLRGVASELGLPLKSVFLAAHLWALGEITGRPAVATGLQVNGRLEQEGADRLLGLFLNIVPVHLDVRQGTWAALAEAAFAAEREVQPFRRYPMAKIQPMAGRGRTLFQVLFNYTDFYVFDELDGLVRTRTGEWWFSDRHSFPLMVEVTSSPRSHRRVVEVTTGTSRSMAGTGSRLGELLLQALNDIAADVTAAGSCRGSGW